MEPDLIYDECGLVIGTAAPLMPRWKVHRFYQGDAGKHTVVDEIEELDELPGLIEQGPHWDTLLLCTVTLNRPAVSRGLTIEQARAL